MNDMITNARSAALSVLLRIERDGAYSNIALASALRDARLSARDKAFAAMLVYGVLERRLLLDYNLSQYSSRNIRELSPEVLEILRLGAYQIYFADSVHAGAAVDESVKLCRSVGEGKASGFVNAVLRAVAKAGQAALPDRKRGKNKYLSIKYSCPEPIIRLWRQSYGDELCERILSSLTGRPPITVRVNTLKTTPEDLAEGFEKEGIIVKSEGFTSGARSLENTGSLESSELYKAGAFHVQDKASQICCELLGVRAGMTVIDACAAPGGKSFTCAELMENRGRIIACDLYEHRCRLIEDGARRLGIDIIETRAGDFREIAALPEADRVLCDVPCSGLGILRRKPELRYKEDTGVESLPKVQYELLTAAAARVKSGGVLLYSTCTLNPSENGGNAGRFLAENRDFEPLPLRLPKGIVRGIDEPENELTLFPGLCGTDGFFISAFRRK